MQYEQNREKIQKFQNRLCQSITMSAQCNATRKETQCSN